MGYTDNKFNSLPANGIQYMRPPMIPDSIEKMNAARLNHDLAQLQHQHYQAKARNRMLKTIAMKNAMIKASAAPKPVPKASKSCPQCFCINKNESNFCQRCCYSFCDLTPAEFRTKAGLNKRPSLTSQTFEPPPSPVSTTSVVFSPPKSPLSNNDSCLSPKSLVRESTSYRAVFGINNQKPSVEYENFSSVSLLDNDDKFAFSLGTTVPQPLTKSSHSETSFLSSTENIFSNTVTTLEDCNPQICNQSDCIKPSEGITENKEASNLGHIVPQSKPNAFISYFKTLGALITSFSTNRVPVADLGETNSFVYDEKTKRWINPNIPISEDIKPMQASTPPKYLPVPQEHKTVHCSGRRKSLRNKYIDVLI